jgi:tetratricopeptide (TPR) repeat protein
MEREKYLIAMILMVSFGGLKASHKTDIYQAYISSNMTEWKKVMDRMDDEKKKSNEFILELLNYQYGYVGWCIGNRKHDLAEEYIRKAEQNMELLEKKEYKMSQVNAYKSAFYGYRIGLNRLQAPFIGPKSISHAEEAIRLDKNNPYGYIQYANTQYYMPRVFGGSKTVALENYIKALHLMELRKIETENNWNYLSLLTIIAMAYENLGQHDMAKACYEKIMKIEPRYLWVKNELYPKLITEMK